MKNLISSLLAFLFAARTTDTILGNLTKAANKLDDHAFQAEVRGTSLQNYASDVREQAADRASAIVVKATDKAASVMTKAKAKAETARTDAATVLDDAKRATAAAARIRELIG